MTSDLQQALTQLIQHINLPVAIQQWIGWWTVLYAIGAITLGVIGFMLLAAGAWGYIKSDFDNVITPFGLGLGTVALLLSFLFTLSWVQIVWYPQAWLLDQLTQQLH